MSDISFEVCLFSALLYIGLPVSTSSNPNDPSVNLGENPKSMVPHTITESHLCTYRYFDPYPADLFKLVTGWSCYNYAHPKWLVNGTVFKPQQSVVGNFSQFRVPYIAYNQKVVWFDYEDPGSVEIIRELHVDEKYFRKWYGCAQAAMECCWNQLDATNQQPSVDFPCPAMWDGYTCFQKTRAGSEVQKLCPLYLTSSEKFICNLKSRKQCTSEGWNHTTDYLTCSSSFRYRERHTFHIVVLLLAAIFMAPAIIIFFAYEKLRRWRIALHRNLILAIFVKNLLVLVTKNVIILDAINVQHGDSLMETDDGWCRTLTFIENLSKNVIFSCMTADAFHTHKTIVRAFSSESNVHLVYGIIAVASTLPTIIWSILMGVNNVGNCWVADDSGYQWVTDGFKYGCLGINVLLLLDIMRVLLMKLGKNTDRKHPGRSIKVALVLIFLFGVPLLISGQRDLVDMDDCLASDIYIYATYSIEALQGVYMVLFFCYLNNDALTELRRTWRNLRIQISERSAHLRHNIKRRSSPLSNMTNLSL